jgi:hypothetical protein
MAKVLSPDFAKSNSTPRALHTQSKEEHFFPSVAYCHPVSKLDDGWPESVEEQGLLLLVWRHHMTGQYIKDVL